MKYMDRNTKKYQEKQKLDEFRRNSDRTERRKRERERQWFVDTIIEDMAWWKSLNSNEHSAIYYEYRKARAEMQFDNCTGHETTLLMEKMKKEYPGDISKRREIVIRQLFSTNSTTKINSI